MGTSYNSSIVTDGLVLCLDAANPRSYPLSGNTWLDLSGQGNNGTLTNGPTFDSANGGSIIFDGTNDYVALNNSSAFKTNQFTIDMWIYFNSYDTGDIATFGVGSGTFAQWGFRMYSGTTTQWFVAGTNNSYYLTSIDVNSSRDTLYPLYTWLNVCFATDTDNVNSQIYVNGVLKRNITASIATYTRESWSSANLYFGGYSWDGYTDTKFGVYKFYNRKLSAEEVRRNYNATRGRYGY